MLRAIRTANFPLLACGQNMNSSIVVGRLSSTGTEVKVPTNIKPETKSSEIKDAPVINTISSINQAQKLPKASNKPKQRPNYRNFEREIIKKAKDYDFKRVHELLQDNPNKKEIISKIYLEQRYYGKVLEMSTEKMQRIECYSRMGYLDRALSDLKTKQEFTTALAGFTRIKSKKAEMELLWQKIKKLHKPDLYLYNTIMRGYSMYEEYEKVLELFDSMIKEFKPDTYTYSILSMCQLQSKDPRFQTLLEKYEYLQSDISKSYEIIFNTRNGQYEFNELVEQFNQRPSLFNRPELVSSLLAALIKRQSQNTHRFVDYLLENKVPPSARLYSLLILLCGRSFNAAYDAWPLYDQMKAKQIPPNEKVFTNLLGIGVKTNSVKKLYELMVDIVQTLHPKSFYRDCLELFACVRPGCVDFEEQSKRNLLRLTLEPNSFSKYEPYVHDFPKGVKPRKKKNIDSGQQHYTNLAIILMTDMLERKVIPQSSHFYSILENALIPTTLTSNAAVKKLHALMLNIKILDPKINLESKFWGTLLNSSRWDIVQEFKDSIDFHKLLRGKITEQGKHGHHLWLYTLATRLELSNELLVLVLENIGLECKQIEYLEAIYSKIPLNILTEQMVWAYVRSLIWLGHHKKAVKIATIEYNEKFDGMVVMELRKWLKLRNLDDLESELVNYWATKQPSWI